MAPALVPHIVEQRRIAHDFEEGAAEFAMLGDLDGATEFGAHGLLAVADAEHRQSEGEDLRRGARRHRLGDARRPARQDDAAQALPRQRRLDAAERHDLGIHAGLAHPPRDQLGVLGAEIDNQDVLGHGNPLVLLRACSSG
jgi:hypothetical protein